MDFTKFTAAIFDLDGTLIESNHVWSKIDREFLGKRNIPVPEDYFKAVSTMNFRAAAEYTNERFGLGENIEDIMNEWHNMAIYEYSHVIQPVSGAVEFVKFLRGSGVKIALATASSPSLYEPVLKHIGIYDCFDFFASTEQVKRGKGYPDVYEFACENVSAKPESSVVLEDIPEGIRGAKAGGFTAVACLNSHYRDDWDRLKAEADTYFSDYAELMPVGVINRN
jgi:beta-phosphoglucomutase-like phosphatase (HAD superfamily)